MTKKTAKPAKPAKVAKASKPSRESQLHALLSQTGGASINEIIQALGWARHSCRGLISTSRRKHGWDVERTTVAALPRDIPSKAKRLKPSVSTTASRSLTQLSKANEQGVRSDKPEPRGS